MCIRDRPKVAGHLEHAMKRIIDNYNKSHEVKLPRITPHVLRHTYCTDMANDGMEVQHLQYFMGHADTYLSLIHIYRVGVPLIF